MGNLPAATYSKKNDSSPSSQQLSSALELEVESSEPLSHQCCNVGWIDLVQVIIVHECIAMLCLEKYYTALSPSSSCQIVP